MFHTAATSTDLGETVIGTDRGGVAAASAGLKVLLVGVSGTARDFLLSLPVLKSAAEENPDIAAAADIDILQCFFIGHDEKDRRCREIVDHAVAFAPDVIGFSVYVWNIDAVLTAAGMLRQALPEARIVFGGPEIAASDVAGGRFQDLPADFLVCGEGEITFVGLLRHLIDPHAHPVAAIPGLAWRRGAFVYNRPADENALLIQDLDRMASPYLTGVISRDFLRRPGMRANIETQRGCNLRCAYCMYHKGMPTVRFRDPQVVLDEMKYIQACGISELRIVDANFFYNREYSAGIIAGMIRERLEFGLFLEVIPLYIDEYIGGLLKEYRALSPRARVAVGIGIQSLNVQSLKAIKRNLPVRYFDRAFAVLSDAGAVIKTDIILGLPHETRATYFELIEYVAEKMRYGFNYLSTALLRILPGSDLEAIAIREGLEVDPQDNEHFVCRTPTMSHRDIVDCMRYNVVANRFFTTNDEAARQKLRDRYFEVKDRLGVSHVALLGSFVDYFTETLAGTGSDFLLEDLLRFEFMYKTIFDEVPDAYIYRRLDQLVADGMPTN